MSDELERIIDIDGDLLLVRAFDMPDRPTCAVGLRVECASPTGIGVGLDIDGITALRAALDKAEMAYWKRMTKAAEGTINGCSCEPSARSRVFKTPVCERSDNAAGWLINEVYEVCPSILGAWQVIPPTHAEQLNKPPLTPACVPPGQIGGRIRSLRRAAGLTLEDTAKAMGTSIPHASSVERGNIIPTPDCVEELAKLFGIDAATLRSNS